MMEKKKKKIRIPANTFRNNFIQLFEKMVPNFDNSIQHSSINLGKIYSVRNIFMEGHQGKEQL